mmetsp:Transcript_1461/g.3464  ORF Transcript_1461/g.3464 Transcript_1461/m.3464 type:complete len:313 (-) Transcript_1461:212-1150(-)
MHNDNRMSLACDAAWHKPPSGWHLSTVIGVGRVTCRVAGQDLGEAGVRPVRSAQAAGVAVQVGCAAERAALVQAPGGNDAAAAGRGKALPAAAEADRERAAPVGRARRGAARCGAARLGRERAQRHVLVVLPQEDVAGEGAGEEQAAGRVRVQRGGVHLRSADEHALCGGVRVGLPIMGLPGPCDVGVGAGVPVVVGLLSLHCRFPGHHGPGIRRPAHVLQHVGHQPRKHAGAVLCVGIGLLLIRLFPCTHQRRDPDAVARGGRGKGVHPAVLVQLAVAAAGGHRHDLVALQLHHADAVRVQLVRLALVRGG